MFCKNSSIQIPKKSAKVKGSYKLKKKVKVSAKRGVCGAQNGGVGAQRVHHAAVAGAPQRESRRQRGGAGDGAQLCQPSAQRLDALGRRDDEIVRVQPRVATGVGDVVHVVHNVVWHEHDADEVVEEADQLSPEGKRKLTVDGVLQRGVGAQHLLRQDVSEHARR